MREPEEKYYFFLGIGGIGMSSLARLYKANGFRLMGYDKTRTKLTQQLEEEGIPVCYEDLPEKLPSEWNAQNTQVVYTPAVPTTSKWHQHFKTNNYVCKKRAEMLGVVTANTINLSVAGTHGKTTTSAMVGHILAKSNYAVTALLGGIVLGYDSNLILNGTKYSVTEADEYDRSFLQLSPESAVITSMDADHLDIYDDANELENTFRLFAQQVKNQLIVKKGLPINGTYTYSAEKDADFTAKNIRSEEGKLCFDLHLLQDKIDVALAPTGRHNIENAVAAAALSFVHGIEPKKIKIGLESFGGVKRRFNTFYGKEMLLIDDYAHHPTEIEAMSKALKELYPTKNTLVVFQPHLYSRTRDFLTDFAAVLNPFTNVLLLDIYPAREEPIPGITSHAIADLMENNPKVSRLENAMEHIKAFPNLELIVTLGAGDIDTLVEPLKKWIHV